MPVVPSVTVHAKELAEGDIEAVNVLPAYRASLAFVDEAALESELGWRRAELERSGAVVSGASTYAHLELLHARCDYSAFVVNAVHAHDARSLGVVGLACKTVPTVAEAMSCHARYQHLTNRSARYAHDLHDDTLRITQTRVGPPSLGRQLMTVFTFLVAVELLEVVSGARPQVRALRVQHRLDAHERRAIAQLIDAPVIENDASNRLDVDAAILQRPTVSADAELREHFLSLLEQAAPGLSEATPFIAQVRTVVDAALVHGEPNLEATARLCGMSGRTLQRRLTEAHTTFAAVVDDARRQRAVAYLDNPQLSLSEVAWLLGYAEHSSFFRAFKRWFDTTPQQWRARHG